MENIKKKKCALRTCLNSFELANSKKKYCSDACRFNGHKQRHETKTKFLKSFQDQFKLNALALQRLFEMEIFNPTPRDLQIAGFDFNVRDQERISEEGHKSFFYFNYVLVIANNKPLEIIKNLNSKAHEISFNSNRTVCKNCNNNSFTEF